MMETRWFDFSRASTHGVPRNFDMPSHRAKEKGTMNKIQSTDEQRAASLLRQGSDSFTSHVTQGH
jgi:hypothetical protein